MISKVSCNAQVIIECVTQCKEKIEIAYVGVNRFKDNLILWTSCYKEKAQYNVKSLFVDLQTVSQIIVSDSKDRITNNIKEYTIQFMGDAILGDDNKPAAKIKFIVMLDMYSLNEQIINFFNIYIRNIKKVTGNKNKLLTIPEMSSNPFINSNKTKRKSTIGYSPLNNMPLTYKQPMQRNFNSGSSRAQTAVRKALGAKNKTEMNRTPNITTNKFYSSPSNRYALTAPNFIKKNKFHKANKQLQKTHNTSARGLRTFQQGNFDFKISRKEKQIGSSLGFRNYANSCYINASLQALLSCRVFADRLFNGIYAKQMQLPSNSSTFYNSVVDIVRKRKENRGVLDLEWLKSSISKRYPRFAGNAQQDTHEFTRQCLNQLNDELLEAHNLSDSPVKVGPIDDAMKSKQLTDTDKEELLAKQDELLSKSPTVLTFRSKVKHHMSCMNPQCSYERNIIEEFFDLSLDIVRRRKLIKGATTEKDHQLINDGEKSQLDASNTVSNEKINNVHLCVDCKDIMKCISSIGTKNASLWYCKTCWNSNNPNVAGVLCFPCKNKVTYDDVSGQMYCSGCGVTIHTDDFKRAINDKNKITDYFHNVNNRNNQNNRPNNNNNKQNHSPDNNLKSNNNNSTSPKPYNIKYLLEHFFDTRTMEFTCEECGQDTSAQMTSSFHTLPKVLMIHLKRFLPNYETQSYEKIRRSIAMNEILDLSSLCENDTQHEDADDITTNNNISNMNNDTSFDDDVYKENFLNSKYNHLHNNYNNNNNTRRSLTAELNQSHEKFNGNNNENSDETVETVSAEKIAELKHKIETAQDPEERQNYELDYALALSTVETTPNKRKLDKNINQHIAKKLKKTTRKLNYDGFKTYSNNHVNNITMNGNPFNDNNKIIHSPNSSPKIDHNNSKEIICVDDDDNDNNNNNTDEAHVDEDEALRKAIEASRLEEVQRRREQADLELALKNSLQDVHNSPHEMSMDDFIDIDQRIENDIKEDKFVGNYVDQMKSTDIDATILPMSNLDDDVNNFNSTKKVPSPQKLKPYQRSVCNINAKYKVRAIIHHLGHSASSGHYITDINHKKSWCRYNDARVNKIDESTALGREAMRTNYILFYERMDTIKDTNITDSPTM